VATATTTVLLCGGRGLRAYPHTAEVPKPLMEVAGVPVLRHVMEIYAGQGFVDFVLAAGYKADLVAAFAEDLPDDWRVRVEDTGEDAGTARRLAACRELVSPIFFANYADGLGDVDLRALLEFHRSHESLASLTCVPLPSQYGTLDLDGDHRVQRFLEKPRLADHLINAGFFVFEEGAFERWAGDDLERDVLPALASSGDLRAFHHHGFWKSMDTYKDAIELSELCATGASPWLPH
jgi:glucose-1-phosphate cytidylyltransferase